jgi:hypothetical protein
VHTIVLPLDPMLAGHAVFLGTNLALIDGDNGPDGSITGAIPGTWQQGDPPVRRWASANF